MTEAFKILLVDDDSNILELFSDILQEQIPDIEIVACSSGNEALKAVESENYYLIITDKKMPGMNGIELIEKIRTGDSLNKNTPALLVTGYPDEEDIVTLNALGNSKTMTKPVNYNDFGKMVELHMPEFKISNA